MTPEEKKDKKTAMIELSIPVNIRGSFMRYGNRWGRFNLHNNWKWVEWGPLEYHQKCTMTMEEMWNNYKNKFKT